MRVALVHDYFTQLGGAEKVADELARIVPEATLLSLVAFDKCLPEGIRGLPMQTSWMQSLPAIDRYYRLYFFLYPFAVSALDLSEYDLVLSSSSGYAKGVRTGPDTIHVCYCHTPMRWVWELNSYSKRESMWWGVSAALPKVIALLRNWDEAAARQPDHFIANSAAVAKRIERVYNRTAQIIHPPIDVGRFRLAKDQGDYYLVLSRLVSYKRLDLAVKACTQLNRKLMVVGDGPHRAALMAEAGPTITFCGRLSDEEVDQMAARCIALISPGEEDFGMAPLEVAAAGRPTIAYKAGGAIETILHGLTGWFFERQETEALVEAILEFESHSWSQELLRRHAKTFDVSRFRDQMLSFMENIGVPLVDDRVVDGAAKQNMSRA